MSKHRLNLNTLMTATHTSEKELRKHLNVQQLTIARWREDGVPITSAFHGMVWDLCISKLSTSELLELRNNPDLYIIQNEKVLGEKPRPSRYSNIIIKRKDDEHDK